MKTVTVSKVGCTRPKAAELLGLTLDELAARDRDLGMVYGRDWRMHRGRCFITPGGLKRLGRGAVEVVVADRPVRRKVLERTEILKKRWDLNYGG